MLNTFFLTDIGNVLALGNLSLYTEGLPEIGDSEHPVGALNDIVKGPAVIQIGLLVCQLLKKTDLLISLT